MHAFGLTDAPATFQRLMESCLGELQLNWYIIYLDDIIVFSRTPEKHLHRLKAIISKLRVASLKLKPMKCDLFWQQINYLGHVIVKKVSQLTLTKSKLSLSGLNPLL